MQCICSVKFFCRLVYQNYKFWYKFLGAGCVLFAQNAGVSVCVFHATSNKNDLSALNVTTIAFKVDSSYSLLERVSQLF